MSLKHHSRNIIIASIIAILFVSIQISNGRTLTVGRGYPYQSIRSAIDAASPGDKVMISPGLYFENSLLVEKKVSLQANGKVVIDGRSDKDILRIRNTSGVIISGIIFRNSGRSSVQDYAAIKMETVENCVVSNCSFENTFFGIHIDFSRESVIKGNRFNGNAVSESNSGNGVHAWKSDSLVISDNIITRHRDGIYLEFVTHTVVKGNTCRDNLRYGLHFMFANNNSYLKNTFSNNGAGVAVMYTHHVHMYGNHFEENWGPASYGLLLKDITDCTIRKNTFSKNTVGIWMEGANRVSLSNNNFTGNGWAMKLLGNCENDSIYSNNFISNSFDISTNSASTGNLNVFSGNFWDKYHGYDLNKDRYGDIPYRPVSLFSTLVERIPPAIVLLHSFLTDLLDEIEKHFPSLIPETLVDSSPLMKRNI